MLLTVHFKDRAVIERIGSFIFMYEGLNLLNRCISCGRRHTWVTRSLQLGLPNVPRKAERSVTRVFGATRERRVERQSFHFMLRLNCRTEVEERKTKCF